jgi:hypothetical protein
MKLFTALFVLTLSRTVTSFLTPQHHRHCSSSCWRLYDKEEENNDTMMDQVQKRHDNFQVENARVALEHAHTQSFLKRRPRKLPYENARIWVQANFGVDTQEEFDDLVANGNLRTPYIPKNPEAYYKETREWISWEHFLKGCFDGETPSAVKPSSGIFD